MSLLIEAWRAEAALYRRDGKEQAARQLETLADRTERLVGMYAAARVAARR